MTSLWIAAAVWLLLSAGFGLVGDISVGAQSASDPSSGTARIDGALAARLSRVNGDEFVRVMVRMEEQPHVVRAMGPELTRFVLQEAATRTQEAVVQYLDAGAAVGDVRAFTPFWLVNVVFAEIRANKLPELASLPGVALVYEDITISLATPEMTVVSDPFAGDTAEPDIVPADAGTQLLRWDHVAAVFAPELWELGIRGEGVTVAVIDTGVDVSHPDLVGAMGGQPPYYEGYWAEFDRNGHIVPGSMPYDSGTHGTHVSGTVAGRNRTYQIGVAPEVTLAHGLVLQGTTGTMPQVLAGMQWVAERGFDVINGSLGSNDIVEEMAVATDNLYAAGVVPVFANGNIRIDGVPPGAPGNTPSAIAIGAYDQNGREAVFNRGDIIEYPGYEYDQYTRIKPDISAPGVDVLSAYPGGRWAHASGTSMASPHAAGVVALLLSAYPDLTVDRIKELLFASTGGHKGRYGWDDIATKDIHFGWGRINAWQAFQLAAAPGDVPVHVTGAVTGEGVPLSGARVTFRGMETTIFTTDDDGRYEGDVPRGIYSVAAEAPRHASATRTVNLIDPPEPVHVDFELEPIHTGTLRGTVTGMASWPGEAGPVGGAVVAIPDLSLQTVTDEHGEYVFDIVRVGEWTVQVQHRNFRTRQRTARVLRDETSVLDVLLEPLGGVVSFRNSFDTAAAQSMWERVDESGAGGWIFTGRRSYSEPYSAWHGYAEGDMGSVLAESHDSGPSAHAPGTSSTDQASYPPGQLARLVSPPFTVLSGGTSFTFRLRAELWGPFHRFHVHILDVAGREKRLLYTFDGVDRTDGWILAAFELKEYIGREVVLEFSVETDALVRPGDDGVFLDDVVVAASDGAMPSRLHGRVMDRSGRGVAGARVTVWHRDEAGSGPPVVETMSGPLGDYEIPLPGGSWTVRVVKTATHLPLTRQIYIDPGDRNSVHFTLDRNTPPGPVVGLQAQPADKSVRLTWDAVDTGGGDTGASYNVYASRDGSAFHRIGAPTEERFVVDGLQNGETYWFRVEAMDRHGLAGEAAEVSAAPDGADPGGPEVRLFDVKPRSLVRGAAVAVRAELGHSAEEEARLDVQLRAALGDKTVGQWEFADQSQGTFEVDVETVDESGRPWAPNVYEMGLVVSDATGNVARSNLIYIALLPPLPRSLSFLLGNNPFNPHIESQLLEYSVPSPGHVHVGVYTLDGRRIRTVVDEWKASGNHAAYWDGADDHGVVVLAGMYVVRVRFIDEDGQSGELTRHSVVVK